MSTKLLQCNKCGGRMRIDPGGVTVIGGGGPPSIVGLRCDRCDITRFERRTDIERELAEAGGAPVPSAVAAAVDFPALFDRSRYGLNLLVGAGYLLAQLLAQFTWIIPALVRGYHFEFNPLRYHLVAVLGLDVFDAAVFVLVVHAVRRARWLPPTWGMAWVVYGVAFRAVMHFLPPAGVPPLPLFDPMSLGMGFVYGFLLMLGLVAGVRLAGFKPWSLMLGASGGYLAGAVLVEFHRAATYGGNGFNWDNTFVTVLNGIILGGCLYGAVVLHHRRRGARPAAAPVRLTPARTGFTTADNHGTLHDRLEIATPYWMARITSPNKEPYVMYLFDRAEDARAALLELPCVHVAQDTGSLICTEVLIFGCYPNEQGKHEAIVGGGDLTYELWEQAKASFEKHGGKRKNDLAPERHVPPPPVAQPADPGRVKFVREDRQQKMGATFVYRVHTAPDAAAAKAFLEKNPVPAKLFYLIVETPEGNYCRDVNGIYKE